MTQQGNPEWLIALIRRIDATFNGKEDDEGNKPIHDFRDEPSAFHGVMPEGYSMPDIVRYMGGYEAPEKVRGPEETALYILQNHVLLDERQSIRPNQPVAWTIAIGDALQRLLIHQYDYSTGNDWGSRTVTPSTTLQSFIDHSARDNHEAFCSSARVEEADVLQDPLRLTTALLGLLVGFKELQYERIATTADNSEILVFPDKYPRLRIQYVDPVLRLYAGGRISVARR